MGDRSVVKVLSIDDDGYGAMVLSHEENKYLWVNDRVYFAPVQPDRIKPYL